jgi:hypothetical protein
MPDCIITNCVITVRVMTRQWITLSIILIFMIAHCLNKSYLIIAARVLRHLKW